MSSASLSLSECLATLKAGTNSEQYLTAMKTMHTYCKNICEKPTEEKYRKVRCANEAFKKRLGNLPGGLDAMRAIGFTSGEGETEGFLVLVPTEAAWGVLTGAKQSLETHIAQAEVARGSGGTGGASGDPMGMAQQMLNQPGMANAMNNPAMLNNPMMTGALQAAMQNPEVLNQVMQNPQVQAMMAANPALQGMMNPEAMQRMMQDPMAQELLSNPAALQQAMQAFQQGGGMAGMGGMGGAMSSGGMGGVGGGMGGMGGGVGMGGAGGMSGAGGMGAVGGGSGDAGLSEQMAGIGFNPAAAPAAAPTAPGSDRQLTDEEMLEMAIQESLRDNQGGPEAGQ